ncbi:MAG: hypothetical protein KKA60_08990 [Proteobacteria bacterium]|nr:hypothetical protein [Pseudomonadota bacterium]
MTMKSKKTFKPGNAGHETSMPSADQDLSEEEKDRIVRNKLRLDPCDEQGIVYLTREEFGVPIVLKRLHRRDNYQDLKTVENLDPLELVHRPGKKPALKHGYRRYRYWTKQGVTKFPCIIVGTAFKLSQILMANMKDMAQLSKPMTNFERSYRLLKLSRHIHRDFGDRVCRHGGKRRGKKDWVSEVQLIHAETGIKIGTIRELLTFGKRIGSYGIAGLAEHYPKGMGTKKIRRLSTEHPNLGKKIRRKVKKLEKKRGRPMPRREKEKIAGPIAYEAIHGDDNPQKSKGKGDPPPKPPRKKKIVPQRDFKALRDLYAEILSATEDLGEILSDKAPADEAICEQFDSVVKACRFFNKILSEMRIRKSVGKKGAQ